MEPHYNQHYFFAEKYGFLKYRCPNGSIGEFGYTHGGRWDFEGLLFKLIELLGWPETVLDAGCGCGGFVATCNKNGIEALGLEFSQYAIDNAIMGAKKYIKRHDLEDIPWLVDKKYDWVLFIDVMEHLFDDKVDQVIAEAKRVAGKWIIAKICTAKWVDEVWIAKRGTYEEVLEQAKREGYEWLVVSGHINMQLPIYWREKFEDNKWRIRDELADRLRRELKLPEDWRTTLILENTKWFEEEFG